VAASVDALPSCRAIYRESWKRSESTESRPGGHGAYECFPSIEIRFNAVAR
jgi:hypothetical protein